MKTRILAVDTLVFWILSIVVALTPLYFDFSIFQSFALAKSVLFKLAVSAILLFYCLFLIFTKINNTNILKVRYFSIPLILFIICSLLSTFLSDQPWTSFVGSYNVPLGLQNTILSISLFFIFVFSIKSERDIHILLILMVISVTLVGSYGLLQYYEIDFLKLIKNSRFSSTAGNSNLAANIMSMVFPFSIYLCFSLQRFVFKCLSFLSVIIIGYSIIICGSRGAWGVLTVSLVVCFFLVLKVIDKKKSSIEFYKLLIFIFYFIILFLLNYFIFERVQNDLFLVVMLFVHVFIYITWSKQNKVTSIFIKNKNSIYLLLLILTFFVSFITIKFAKDNFDVIGKFSTIFHYEKNARIYVIRDSIYPIIKNFFWGSGPETFRAAFAPYMSKELVKVHKGIIWDTAHNVYVNLWVTRGIFSLLCYLWFFILIIKKSFNILNYGQSDNRKKFLGITLLVSVVIYLLLSLISFDTNTTVPTLFTILALMTVWIFQNDKSKRTLLKKNHKRISFAIKMSTFVLIPFAITSIYVTYRVYVGDRYYANYYLINKKKLNEKDENKRLHLLKIAGFQLQKAIKYNPYESVYRLKMIDTLKKLYTLNRDSKYLEMIDGHLKAAIKHNWNPIEVYSKKLVHDYFKKDYKQAMGSVQTLLHYAPNNYKAKERLCYLYILKNDISSILKAIPCFQDVLKKDPKSLISNTYLAQIYMHQKKHTEALQYAQMAYKHHPEKKKLLKKLINEIKKYMNMN